MVSAHLTSTAAIIAAIAPLSSAFAPSNTPLPSRSSSSLASYLDGLSGQQQPNSAYAAPPVAVAESTGFCHVPLDYFAFDNLSSKGPRGSCDWGAAQDWSRKLADDGVFRGGTWYCTEGGWESPNGKATTEVFYVVEGHGMLGDADGTKHFFGPGDMVIIPKGHTGRWDVNTPIHKVWAVNAHDNIEESGPAIRVQVDHFKDFAPHCLGDTSANDPLYGNTGGVSSSSNTFYNVGPTQVGVWTCEPGSFEVAYGERQWFHVVEGAMFVTDSSDGTSKRCAAGDTVMLPAGWSGYVDVVETVKKVFTVAK